MDTSSTSFPIFRHFPGSPLAEHKPLDAFIHPFHPNPLRAFAASCFNLVQSALRFINVLVLHLY